MRPEKEGRAVARVGDPPVADGAWFDPRAPRPYNRGILKASRKASSFHGKCGDHNAPATEPMSHNSFGHLFRVTTFGESHGPALGASSTAVRRAFR